MTDGGARASGEAYERSGRQAAVALRGYCSVLVISAEPVAAAHVALGIARAEAAHRRVVICDLAGEVPLLQSLVTDDDPHGVFDSFTFGTSLEKVIRSIGGNENLNVLPSGTESAATAEIVGDRRWRSIASDFAAADALLLLVAGENLPALDKLTAVIDGMLLVGEPNLAAAPNAVLLARIPHPGEFRSASNIEAPPREPLWRSRGVVLTAIAAALLVAALVTLRPGNTARPALTRAPDTVMIPRPDSMTQDSITNARRTAVRTANPADSAETAETTEAAPFSVAILAANTAEGANFELQRHGAMMPAATISLVPVGDTEAISYKVHAGAFSDSASAERLLASLRRRHIVPDSGGSVVRTPFALRVDSVPSQAGVLQRSQEKIKGYAARGLAVYALVQRDGSARLYAGAFDKPEQSSLAATALRVAGVTPVLEYRTGRVQ